MLIIYYNFEFNIIYIQYFIYKLTAIKTLILLNLYNICISQFVGKNSYKLGVFLGVSY